MFNLTAEVLDPLDLERRANLIRATCDVASTMSGKFSSLQKLLQDAYHSPSYMYCGPHRVNLVNGRTVVAIRKTDSDWVEKLYLVVKLLRKQGRLIESMGTQSPYHQEILGISLSPVLHWHRRILQFLHEHESRGLRKPC